MNRIMNPTAPESFPARNVKNAASYARQGPPPPDFGTSLTFNENKKHANYQSGNAEVRNVNEMGYNRPFNEDTALKPLSLPSIPPSSPITRAKAAIGQAQNDFLRINNALEEENDRRKPPGAWKNMGTPLISEPMIRSAQKEQKLQYRMELERQIVASQMRKAEQLRREKDTNDHPLGPAYAHPALTYYNPPQKINGPRSASTTAALTKFMKEKYSLGDPSSLSARSPNILTPRYSQEMLGCNSAPPSGRAQAPPKMEKVVQQQPSNSLPLPKPERQLSPNEIREKNQANAPVPTRPPIQQTRPLPQPVAPPVHHPRSHPNPGFMPQQFPFYPGMQQPSRQFPYGFPYPMNSWPMYQHPAYAQYCNQLAAAGGDNNGTAQQRAMAAAVAQYYAQQSHPQQRNYPGQMSMPQPSGNVWGDQQEDDDECRGPHQDIDFEYEFENLKEKAYKSPKIWQTSDELPDPVLRTTVYKVELRKQIDEDRRRKADRIARERLEDEKIDRKIREFQEEERRRMAMEERTREKLEDYLETKIEEKAKRKHEAFKIVRVAGSGSGRRQEEPNIRQHRQRGHHTMAFPLKEQVGERGGDFEEGFLDAEPFRKRAQDNEYEQVSREEFIQAFSAGRDNPSPLIKSPRQASQPQPQRQCSPPVPVVQRQLVTKSKLENNKKQSVFPIVVNPVGQNFLCHLKERLKSEKDLVERRLREKVESTHKNINLLKYTLNH